MNRRGFLRLIGATGAAALTASCNRTICGGTLSSPADLVRFPEKTEMILLTDRPPQLETSSHAFADVIADTANRSVPSDRHLEIAPR